MQSETYCIILSVVLSVVSVGLGLMYAVNEVW